MKKMLMVLLMLAMLLCAAGAMAEEVFYVEYTWNDAAKTLVSQTSEVPDGYQTVSSDMKPYWGENDKESWYVVSSCAMIDYRIIVLGEVHLVLCSGTKLTASRGVTVAKGSELIIHGTPNGPGELIANAENMDYQAGIGGESGVSGLRVSQDQSTAAK